MSTSSYQALYDRIAADHVYHWTRTGGGNPFQDKHAVRANEDETARLIGEGSILDVGCGMGDLLLRFPDRDRHGVDISDDYLEVARSRGLEVTNASAEALPFDDDSFDVVVAADILEHVYDLHRVASELQRVAKKLIVVRVPKEDYVSWDVPPYGVVHVRIFDEGTLRVLFETILGCTIRECFTAGECIHLSCSP